MILPCLRSLNGSTEAHEKIAEEPPAECRSSEAKVDGRAGQKSAGPVPVPKASTAKMLGTALRASFQKSRYRQQALRALFKPKRTIMNHEPIKQRPCADCGRQGPRPRCHRCYKKRSRNEDKKLMKTGASVLCEAVGVTPLELVKIVLMVRNNTNNFRL